MSSPITALAAVVPHYRNPGPLPTKQRLASGVAGVSLLFSGLRRGGLFGVMMAAAGADLLYRGFSGEGHIYELVQRSNGKLLPEPVADSATA